METDVQKKKKTSQDKTRNRKRPERERERERDRQIEKFTELSVSQMFVISHKPQQK
jgi:hypothetical protein